jgi:hypothetical protein
MVSIYKVRLIRILGFLALLLIGYVPVATHASTVPVAYPDQPACRVKAIQELPSTFDGLVQSPASNLWVAGQYDPNGVSQVYTTASTSNNLTCITCAARPGVPRVDRNKFMTAWHPSGQWLSIAVEEDSYFWEWLPQSWKRGFLGSGVWMNMWVTTPAGDRWYQMTDFNPPWNGPSQGYTGVAWAPDGRHGVWAELVGNVDAIDAFGVWRLYLADFSVDQTGSPHWTNKRDITPAGAKWVEPGNFSPDGTHLLISTDIGINSALGQDQWSLNIETGELQNLTNSPTVWDEHGLYSPAGNKIIFMSSYPYRDDPSSDRFLWLETEFMLMDADGAHLQQLTHFNVQAIPNRKILGLWLRLPGLWQAGHKFARR